MKRNFFKKLLIGGLITSICICCCFIKVKADTPSLRDIYDNYPEDYSIYGMYDGNLQYWEGKTLYFTPYLNLERINYISNYNEFDISITWENQIKTGGQFPFAVIRANFGYGNGELSNYDYIACYGFRFRSWFNDDLLLGIDVLTSTNDWFTIYEYYTDQEFYYYLPYNFINSRMLTFGLSELYDFTISSNSVDMSMINNLNDKFGFNYTSVNKESLTAFTSLLLMDTTIEVIPSHLLNQFQDYENTRITQQLLQRYEQGFQNGYAQGISDSSDSYRIPFLTGVFNAVSDVLSIEVFPNVKLSYFIFIPLVLGITGMILWFWRKD